MSCQNPIADSPILTASVCVTHLSAQANSARYVPQPPIRFQRTTPGSRPALSLRAALQHEGDNSWTVLLRGVPLREVARTPRKPGAFCQRAINFFA